MNIGPILRAMKHNRTRVVLIVLEIAITLAIVTNCINVILAERAKMAKESGFDDDRLLLLRVRPFTPEFREAPFRRVTIEADLRAIESTPGVEAVANTGLQLWEGGGSSSNIVAVGANREDEGNQMQTYYATKDVLQTLGAKIIAGRGFRESDYTTGGEQDPADVVVLSKGAADALFPDGNAVGKAVRYSINPGDTEGKHYTVVGVIEEFYNPFGMPGGEPLPMEERVILFPSRTSGYQYGMPYIIRAEPGAMPSVMSQVEQKLAAVNPGRVFEFQTLNEKKARWFSGSSILVTTMTLIIVALVGVTALGLLGLTSLSVAERTKQIGTRRALGATRAEILRHFLVENCVITAAGLVLGVAAAYALNVLLVSQVTNVKLPWELVAIGMALLLVNAFAATIPPALRATRISPAIATRSV